MSTPSATTAVQGNGAPPSGEPSSLRSRVIEILAGTANGCLTELGYYPGMPQRLQELERQNAEWQKENVKLFQDNQTLTQALQECKSSQPEKTIQALQTQIQGLIQEKAMLMKQNRTLLAGQPIAYHNLLTEYKQFQEHYQRALQEIKTLRRNNAILSGRTPVQSPVSPGSLIFSPPIIGPQAQGVPPQVQKSPITPGPVVFAPPFSSPQGVPPHAQKPPSSAGFFSVVPQNPAVNTIQPTIPVTSQQPRQIPKGDQNHARNLTPTLPHTQQDPSLASQTNMRHPHPDKGINLPSSISRLSMPRSSSRPVSSTTLSRPASPLSVSTTPAVLVRDPKMVTYIPAPMSAPPIPRRHPLHSAAVFETPSSQQAHPPVTNTMAPLRKYSLPTPSHSMEPSFLMTPSALLVSIPDPPTTQPIKGTITPKDTMNDPPISLSTDVNGNEEQKPMVGLVNVPINHRRQSCPATPFQAVTPMNAFIEDPSTVSIVTSPPVESLKRPSLVMPNVDELPAPKKPRIEGQENVDRTVKGLEGQENVDSSVEPTGFEGQENVDSSVKPTGLEGQENVDSFVKPTVLKGKENVDSSVEPTKLEEQENVEGSVEPMGLEGQEKVDSSADPLADTMETLVASEDDEESEDEDIRVGPDGLRLVEDCLPALIEIDEKNADLKICKLCAARFTLGYTTTEPRPFINATTEELVHHCASEHQSAWERLRNTIT